MLSLREHIADIAELTNEEAAVEVISLRGSYTNGAFVNSAPYNLVQGYDYSLDAIWGAIQSPWDFDTQGDFTRFKFNISMTGARSKVFAEDINGGAICNLFGAAAPMPFGRGIYRLYGGRQVTLALASDGTGAWSGGNRDIVVNLLCSRILQSIVDKIHKITRTT